MIKFFRKIRQKLLTENKFSKYLLYAIGEILLVVIGIMIALSVNNQNQQRAQEKEIKATLIEIQRDITNDVGFSNYFMYFFIEKDSIKNLLMNDKISYEDIRNENLNVSSLVYKYLAMKIQTNGYQQFSNKIDKMPEKYDELVLMLNQLYQTGAPDIKYDLSRYRDHVFKNISEAYEQFEWRAQEEFTGEISDEMIDYMLNNPQYKSDAMNTFNDVNELSRSIMRYRPRAIDIYFKIDEMLNSEGYETRDYIRNTSLADSTQATRLVGNYEQISGPLESRLGRTMEVTARGKQLYVNVQDKEEILLYYIFGSQLFYFKNGSSILKFNQNENEDLTIIGDGLDERKWKRVTKSY